MIPFATFSHNISFRWPLLVPAVLLASVFIYYLIPVKRPGQVPIEDLAIPAETPAEETSSDAVQDSSSNDSEMPPMYYQPRIQVLEQSKPPLASHIISQELSQKVSQIEAARVKQPYDAFLVLDVEATCLQGAGFDWPNEIIEWPVCLLRWKDKSAKGKASQLEIVDEFRSFVKPTWRPQLSEFCTDLTGITQAQVNYAPTFPKVLKMFTRFLAQHGLIDPRNGRPMQRFCWCSDGPFDIRDFVVKQCFISNIPMPSWLKGDVLDVRRVVSVWAATNGASENQQIRTRFATSYHLRSLNIPQQLRALGLGPFQGRAHSGIDDTRNIARVAIELARRGIRLEPNTSINPNRRWQWMGRPGEVLEYCLI
ncbi:hypothetical protein HYDPIDRAFT_80257 [Hydnomerulius pinastri MD-312]|nr:hypothetical protein HYDPIDRAFT_80257 [Hydnomerulius pinastri MD-312]